MERVEPNPQPGREPFRVPRFEIERRTATIQAELRRAGIDGLFIVQRVDLFYFSGTAQNGFLYLPAEGAPMLFIKQSVARAREESALDPLVEIATVKAIPGLVTDILGRPPVRLAMELDVSGKPESMPRHEQKSGTMRMCRQIGVTP